MGEEGIDGRRARPSQARSVATLERILDAARTLLVERGLPGFNTNQLAERAGINIGTLYHYFEDKNAVLHELFVRDQAVRAAFFERQLAVFAESDDLDAWVRRTVDGLLKARRSQPGTAALRAACRAVPELAEAELRNSEQVAAAVARALRARFPHVSARRAAVAGHLIQEVGSAVLDMAGGRPGDASIIRRELIALMRGYLAEVDAGR
ncbi:MAG: TetR/AcrR family transcriptional regulator [Acidimicrobiales bacterium]